MRCRGHDEDDNGRTRTDPFPQHLYTRLLPIFIHSPVAPVPCPSAAAGGIFPVHCPSPSVGIMSLSIGKRLKILLYEFDPTRSQSLSQCGECVALALFYYQHIVVRPTDGMASGLVLLIWSMGTLFQDSPRCGVGWDGKGPRKGCVGDGISL